MICNYCPRGCKIERDDEKSNGFCGSGNLPKLARVGAHFWEEPCISGTKGSGTVFFSNCTLRCAFCQNYEISALGKGRIISIQALADEYKKLEESGVHNINLVSATQYLDAVIKSLEIYKPKIPVIYNCGGYESVETVKRLEGYVDIFLPDFKYADDGLALKYSKAPNYTDTALKAIEQMLFQTKNNIFDENNLIQRGVIIRHLILPNHTKNSIAVLKLIKENFKTNVLVSLMGQYLPCGRASDFEKLNRKLTKREYEKVFYVMSELGLDGYCQKLKSADKDYIPQWDF